MVTINHLRKIRYTTASACHSCSAWQDGSDSYLCQLTNHVTMTSFSAEWFVGVVIGRVDFRPMKKWHFIQVQVL